MCGIAGVILRRGEVSEARLIAMGRSQQHRGPDNFSVLREGRCGFAHNRLSIIDLSDAGNQPFVNDRYVLLYNGEIYNYRSLGADLKNLGIQFWSTSDTEVLFYSLIHLGFFETLARIRGMFAFSFYDRQDALLYLARDRLGIKPLFWTKNSQGFFWSSEVKALQAITDIELDPVRTLFSANGISDKANHSTPFRDVFHLPPGHCMIYKGHEANTKPIQYYNLSDEVDEAYFKELEGQSRDQVVARFYSLLEASTESMLMSDAPMGAFVSGGIDSSLISVLASNHDPDLSLFTSNVTGKFSEFSDAQRLCRLIGRDLFDSRFEPDMLISNWAKCTYHYEAPIVTHTNAVPFSLVAELAHQTGVKAVLTGEGSDELFLGYPKLLTREFDRYISAPLKILKSIYRFVPGLNEYVFSENSRTLMDFLEMLAQGFERQVFRNQGLGAYHFLPIKEAQNHYLTIQMLREGLVALLFRNDRMGMLASIESRFPFLDEEILRFSVNLPLKWKIGRSRRFHNYKHPFRLDKAIVRYAARGLLPPELVNKRKNGFPMYGYKFLRIKPGYFQGGYLAEILPLDLSAEEHMISKHDPYHIAKLAAVDIFGRLFGQQESVEKITEHLQKWVAIGT